MAESRDLGNAMKAGMRHLASGVAVIATRGGDAVPHAMTVTSITSVSDQPASLLVCLHRDSTTFKSLAGTDLFSINILRRDQENISDRCAFTPEDQDRFVFGDWKDFGEHQIPYLPSALAFFLCRVIRKVDYGTHCIVVGDIMEVIEDEKAAQPLIYCRGEYSSLL
ncbi:MAG: flavin reductase family protein [Cellvibrionaceae bacterium]